MIKSIADELVEYMVIKQSIIDRMAAEKAPSQEFELEIADHIIRTAIINAKSVVIKINCVNREAYKSGVDSH